MINITTRKVDFNELSVKNISKRGVLQAIEIFWNGNGYEYINFLENNNFEYNKDFDRIDELKETLNSDIARLKELAENNQLEKFDYKTITLLKNNLKPINDGDFFQIQFNLKNIENEEIKNQIKNIFLDLQSCSLVEFQNINDDYCSLVYHKRGVLFYNNEPHFAITKNSYSMLENFQEPKDNNFVMARFLFDFAKKLKENGIDESFAVEYANGDKNIKSVDEILYWGSLNVEEKKIEREKEKEKSIINNEAEKLAKAEIKSEMNSNRESLPKDSTAEILDNAKETRLFNIENIDKLNTDSKKSEIKLETQNKEENSIKNVIEKSFELYTQKEMEKTKIRLEKAKKDSLNAYNDLKDYLNAGLSILEAIKNIQQKWRNEDTINYASLLFAEDILKVAQKDTKINELNAEISNLSDKLEKSDKEIEKKEETISKLRSTLQTKINEISNLKFELEEEFAKKEANTQKAFEADLANFRAESDNIISEYEKELENRIKENDSLKEQNTKLKIQYEMMAQELKENKQNENPEIQRELIRLQTKVEQFEKNEKDYKDRINNLESKNEKMLEIIANKGNVNNIDKNSNKKETSDKYESDEYENKPKRSRDILGDKF